MTSVDLPLAQIEAARAALRPLLPNLPCLSVEDGAARAGRLLVKPECLMPTGSFKIRGAMFRLSQLSAEERARGVIAYSTGNHAQAVAKAAERFGLRAVIVMSPDVPANKIEATARWGAEIVMAEPTSQARRALAEQLAAEQGLILVPPYDDLAIMAGQGTIGLEILADFPNPADLTVYVPIGGGGLIAGVAAAIKQRNPAIRVIGVEPDLENDAFRSFRSGERVALNGPSESIADAIKVQMLGDLTWPLIQRYVDDVETVDEAEIAAASRACFNSLKLVVEPGGAVAFAAADRASRARGGTALALLCGGNVTLERLARF
jgi:threonine dehydratase